MSENKAAARLRHIHNKIQIINALKSRNISTATLEYSGQGDEGHTQEVEYSPPCEAAEPKVTIQVNSQVIVHGQWVVRESEETMLLDDALNAFLEDLLEIEDHELYGDGDGGGGTLIVDADEGTFKLSHYDNVVTQSYSYHEG